MCEEKFGSLSFEYEFDQVMRHDATDYDDDDEQLFGVLPTSTKEHTLQTDCEKEVKVEEQIDEYALLSIESEISKLDIQERED